MLSRIQSYVGSFLSLLVVGAGFFHLFQFTFREWPWVFDAWVLIGLGTAGYGIFKIDRWPE